MNDAVRRRFNNVSQSKTFHNILDKYGLSKEAVLDVGCSYGEFLKHFGTGSVGLTIAKEEADSGRESGLDIRVANIEDPDFSMDKKFDAIFANNIFEHLRSPHDFLINIKRLLNPEGILILGVPCIPYITPFLHLRKFRGALASPHINFFTIGTLKKTVERGGWEIKETRGFRFSNPMIDYLLNPIYPHVYIIAVPKQGFSYSAKRQKELEGYN